MTALDAATGRCATCAKVVHATSAPTAGVFIERDGKLLLVRRGAAPAEGRWDVPGGFLEEGERPEDGARREIREELGVELGDMELAMVDVNPLPDGAVLDILFEASDVRGEPRAGSDAAELGWFAPDDLPRDLAFDSTARILERWRRRRRGDELRLLGGDVIRLAEAPTVHCWSAPLTAIPADWRAECGDWTVHDGALCGRSDSEHPAALWLDVPVEGDHALAFTAWTMSPHVNDVNCYWEGSGRIHGDGDIECTIGGIAGWWDGLTGIERYPEGGLRATARTGPLQPRRAMEVVAGRRGSTDFLFVDGELVLQLDDPSRPRRESSRVALATWNGHVHVARVTVHRLGSVD